MFAANGALLHAEENARTDSSLPQLSRWECDSDVSSAQVEFHHEPGRLDPPGGRSFQYRREDGQGDEEIAEFLGLKIAELPSNMAFPSFTNMLIYESNRLI